MHQAGGAGGEEGQSPAMDALIACKHTALLALADAKYDKIVHVRQAAHKAIDEVDSLPEPLTPRKDSSRGDALEDLMASLPTANGNGAHAPNGLDACPSSRSDCECFCQRMLPGLQLASEAAYQYALQSADKWLAACLLSRPAGTCEISCTGLGDRILWLTGLTFIHNLWPGLHAKRRERIACCLIAPN